MNFKIDMTKTIYMNFKILNNTEKQTKKKLKNNIISTVTKTKFLGITIEQALNWKKHIEKLQ